jgi:hypothetical protein
MVFKHDLAIEAIPLIFSGFALPQLENAVISFRTP